MNALLRISRRVFQWNNFKIKIGRFWLDGLVVWSNLDVGFSYFDNLWRALAHSWCAAICATRFDLNYLAAAVVTLMSAITALIGCVLTTAAAAALKKPFYGALRGAGSYVAHLSVKSHTAATSTAAEMLRFSFAAPSYSPAGSRIADISAI